MSMKIKPLIMEMKHDGKDELFKKSSEHTIKAIIRNNVSKFYSDDVITEDHITEYEKVSLTMSVYGITVNTQQAANIWKDRCKKFSYILPVSDNPELVMWDILAFSDILLYK